MGKEHPIELFMPPNMLKAKVGGTTRGIDTAAIAHAERAVDALKLEFNGWFQSDMNRLVEAREKFATRQDAKARSDLFRGSLDIKGQAATFGFPLIARIASSLCKLIDALKSPEAIPPLLVDAHVTAIRIIYRDKISDTPSRTTLELIEELESHVLETIGAAAA